MLLPVVSVALLALAPGDAMWRHLISTVLPRAFSQTVLLMLGVGAVTAAMGTITAWLVTTCRFPGRDLLGWLLLIPLAMPTYIIAYCYADLLDTAGPVQQALRAVMGYHTVHDYWFPDVRSLGGLIVVLSGVLYPYVYLSARASFLQQSVGTIEVARTLGRSPVDVFFSVALPMARPALAAGVSLALMECLNDIGAAQHLGVQTLTVTAYATWLQRSSLAGAAQIASITVLMVLGLLALEHAMRGQAGYHDPGGRFRPMSGWELQGWRRYAAPFVCLAPFVIGFALPVAVLIGNTVRFGSELLEPGFWRAAAASLSLAAVAALVSAVLALVLAYARRVAPNGFTRPGVRLAGLGYVLPGTVLAIGLLIPLARFDNGLDAFLRGTFGVSTGLMLSGSAFALVLAYAIRFMAVSHGAIGAGLSRISPSLDAAARTLGESAMTTLRRVHFPLLKPTLGAALLLVFVDCMKELPATLLLRPFNFETLATRVYGFAALERFEEAALGALMIVLVGLVPVVLLNRTIAPVTGVPFTVAPDGMN